MDQVKIGLIGYGAIGRVHALGYRAIPFHYGLPADSVQIVGVATSRPESAAAAAQEIGCDYWTADYRELLARPDIQVVDVNVPNHLHEEIVLAAAAAGKHIYCEKPLAVSVEQGKRMVQAAAAAGVLTQMTFNFRFFPALERARQLIAEGFLGRLYSFRGRYYRSSYIDPAKPLSWKLRSETSGAGALYDIGSHIIDLLYSMLGEFGQVQATLETVIRERPVAAGSAEMAAVDVDDIALMHVRLRDGTLGVVEASRLGTGFTNELTFETLRREGFNPLRRGRFRLSRSLRRARRRCANWRSPRHHAHRGGQSLSRCEDSGLDDGAGILAHTHGVPGGLPARRGRATAEQPNACGWLARAGRSRGGAPFVTAAALGECG